MSLPTLPTPACTTYFDVECVEVATRFYKAEQMQAYGQQCREQLIAERDALAADAARYRWLRRSATKLSFDNALIGSLVRDQSELDGALKEAGVQ